MQKKRFLLKINFIAAMLFSFQHAHAQSIFPEWIANPQTVNSVPSNCIYGRDTSTPDAEVSVSLEQAQNVYGLYDSASNGTATDSNITQEEKDGLTALAEIFKGWYETSRYLKVEGPVQVIQGKSTQFKANTFDPYNYVSFYSFEDGFIGRDKTNIEANAYKNITFDTTHGSSVVWAVDDGRCSAIGVRVQKAPTITFLGYNQNTGVARYRYTIDKYSTNSMKNLKSLISLNFYRKNGAAATALTHASSGEGEVSFNVLDVPSTYYEMPQISAFIYDGKFSATSALYQTLKPGTTPSTIVDTSTPNKLLYSSGPDGNYIEPGCAWFTNGSNAQIFLCGPTPVADWTWTGTNKASNCKIIPYSGYKFTGGCPSAIKLEKIL